MAISWTLNSGVLTISGSGEWYGYYGSDTPPWYENRDSITSAIIQNGITNIGNRAFYKCTALTSVTIPSSVTDINGSVFDTCTALTNITIPDSVTSIGVSAFHNCSNLTSITIPNSVTSIGASAFNECRALTSITIPNKVTSIDDRVFYNCRALTNVIILNRVTNIGEQAFYGCRVLADIYYIGNETNWNSITIGANNDPLLNATKHYNYSPIVASGYCGGIDDGTNLSWTLVENGVLTINGTGVMNNYNAYEAPWYGNRNLITSIVIESGVTNIGNDAFYECSKSTNVTIPNSVMSIGHEAFRGCTVLKNVTIPDNVTSIDSYAFYNCPELENVTISDNITSIGNRAFSHCYKLTAINVSANNTSYSSVDGVLFNKTKTNLIQYPIGNPLTNYTIPNSVTKLGDDAFNGCKSLISVTIPNNVTSIGHSTFTGCASLTSITIPDSVTNLGPYAFYGCTELTDMTIPNSITSIGICAFSVCTSLTSITIPNSVTTINQYAFENCTALTDVYYTGNEIDWNAITIGTSNEPLLNATIHYNYVPIVASGYCGGEGDGTNLSWTLTENGVLTISGTGVMENFTALAGIPWFMNRNSITSIIIEDGVTNIGNYAFKQCSTLTNITIPNSITSIGMQVFYNCPTLTNVIIPDNVTSIGQQTFFGCTSLTSATVPDSITNIGKQTFYNCSALTSVTIPNSVTNIGDSAFYACFALTDVYYSGSETDWNAITIDTQNDPLLNAAIHYSSSSTNSIYLVTKAELTSIANAIRAKAGTTSKYTWPSQMINAIREIPQLDTTDATATPTDILDGKTAYVNGEKITGTASGGGSATEPYCEYTFDTNGNVTAAKLYGFTSIPSSMFRSYIYLENIDISESPNITKIGDFAFYGCTKLILDSLPSGLTSIGQSAFYNCLAVTFTSLPNGLTSIGQSAFYGCKNIELTSLPIGITDIPQQAFDGCTKCAFSYLPSTIKSFGDYAFRKCLGITEIEIAASLKDAFEPTSIFGNNTNLKKVWLRNTCTTIQTKSASRAPFAGCSTSLAIYAEPSEKLSGWGTYYNRTGSSGGTEVAVTFNQTTRPW